MKIPYKTLLVAGVLGFCATGWSQTAAPVAQPNDADKQIAALQAKLFAFAQLSRYKADNEALAAPAPGERRVVFFGDSITDGWKLAEWFPGKPYVNRGISGQTTSQMVLRFHQDVVDLRPSAVLILAGTNDVAQNTGPMTPEMTQDNFRAMVEMAKANGIKVAIASILPAGDFSWHKGLEPAPKIRALNAWLQAYCKSEGLTYVDYYSPMADEAGAMKAGLSADGVHPNAKGHEIMAPLAQAGIEKTLGK